MKKLEKLFSNFKIGKLQLKNRITMVPMFVGYADREGLVNGMVLEHYRTMAASGASMIVVENTAVHLSGLRAKNSLRIDHDGCIPGLAQLAEAIHKEGALAFLQLSHAGRHAYFPHRIAPSPVDTWGITPMEMTVDTIETTIESFSSAARRAREASFDGIEIDGGTGHLLVQFLSPLTNHREDSFGGSLENRMRLPLSVVDAIMEGAGRDYPVGYRFLADEYLPGGLHPDETLILARELARKNIAYLSVTAGTYDSFYSPEYLEMDKKEGYMLDLSEAVREAVPRIPVIASGRIQSPETANGALEKGKADLIGLARALFADPLWPKKAAGLVEGKIVRFNRACSLCTKRAMVGLPAFCARWDKKHRREFMRKANNSVRAAVMYPNAILVSDE